MGRGGGRGEGSEVSCEETEVEFLPRRGSAFWGRGELGRRGWLGFLGWVFCEDCEVLPKNCGGVVWVGLLGGL